VSAISSARVSRDPRRKIQTNHLAPAIPSLSLKRKEPIPSVSNEEEFVIKIPPQTKKYVGTQPSLPPQGIYPCADFNLNKHGCDQRGCIDTKLCAVCGSERHGWVVCPKKKLCPDFNIGTCKYGLGCDRRHWCLLCHKEHPLNACELLFTQSKGRIRHPSDDFCLLWNAVGQCDGKDCYRKKHKCLYCQKAGRMSHASFECNHALTTLITMEFKDARN
jgi:hypothetical protein